MESVLEDHTKYGGGKHGSVVPEAEAVEKTFSTDLIRCKMVRAGL